MKFLFAFSVDEDFDTENEMNAMLNRVKTFRTEEEIENCMI